MKRTHASYATWKNKTPAPCHPDQPHHGNGLCHECYVRDYYWKHRTEILAKKKADYRAQSEKYGAEYYAKRRQANPQRYLLHGAQDRARRHSVPCTITEADIVIPETCPILGMPLRLSFKNDAGTLRAAPNSPSLDRIDPALGYIPGNVAVISYRANVIKNDGTAEEHEKIGAWMRKVKSL